MRTDGLTHTHKTFPLCYAVNSVAWCIVLVEFSLLGLRLINVGSAELSPVHY